MDEPDHDDGSFGGTFEDLEFDPEEEDIPVHMLMSGKQFKILNKNLNTIIQSQADAGGSRLMSSMELDVILKTFEARLFNKFSVFLQASENRVIEKVDQKDKNTELLIKAQSTNFVGEVQDFKRVVQERHVLFVQDVKKLIEDVNLKLQEIREDMQKEIAIVQHDYASLNQKMDIIVDMVTKFVKLYEALSPKISQLSSDESKSFWEVTTLLNDLKTLILKSSSSSLITPKFFSQKFLLFEWQRNLFLLRLQHGKSSQLLLQKRRLFPLKFQLQ